MFYINKITDSASQQLNLTGIQGIQISVTLQYFPRIQQWAMGFSYNDITVNGIVITNALNILRQFRNRIPFGIACLRADGLDPYQVSDFQNKVANLYLLDSTDVAAIESQWFGNG